MNDFNKLQEAYDLSNTKPDKVYSILPTTLLLLQPIERKRILDAGCGSGFFTEKIARWNPSIVYGVDNRRKSLEKAKTNTSKGVVYQLKDIFKEKLPRVEEICAPFVINYAETQAMLAQLFNNFHTCLEGGRLVGVIDLPDNSKDLTLTAKRRTWGAIKKVRGRLKDGAEIKISLYNNQREICSLLSTYWSKSTIEKTLINAGFTDIKWFKPVIDREGLDKFGEEFWEKYEDYCELGYFTAEKSNS
ncbi:MAG: class I SAM-dependent methyltransferase [Nanoarchaeota archaeon]